MRLLACGSVALLMALTLPHRVSGQDVAPVDSASTPLLALPFVPQSEALCGGAALAMVLRHYGVGGVQAEDFAHLVIDSGVGIRTTDLVDAARARGLTATPFRARGDVVRALLAAHEPVVALIEDRPGVYHYVVLLAWGDGRVLFHDPAVGPHQVMRETALMDAWAPAGFWALRLVHAEGAQGAHRAVGGRMRPESAARSDAVAHGSVPRSSKALDACDELLATAAADATRGDLGSVERALDEADRACADASLVARERAGLRFRQGRYDEAIAYAERRTAAEAGDAHAWELLGASRFVRGERDAALVAWNRIGRPINDLTQIDGLRRTPYPVAAAAIAIPPGALVTPVSLARARRRLGSVPSIARARVDYRPISVDSGRVEAAALERPMLPLTPLDLAMHGARAAIEQRVLLQPTNLLRLGESWHVDATWERNRRAFALGVRLPRVVGMRALTSIDARVHDYTFAPGSGAGSPPADSLLARESVRGAALGVQDWASGALHWRAELGVEDWTGLGTYGRVLLGTALHFADDRVVLDLEASGWLRDASSTFGRMRLDAWLDAPLGRSLEALLLLHGQLTDDAAPRALHAGAGTGRTGSTLLRAHPLLADGIVQSRFWAPRLAGATLELRRWIAGVGPVRVGAAGFLDAAAAEGALAVAGVHGASARAVDAGLGLRIALPTGATARLDVAWSAASGAPVLSAGWMVR